MTTQEHTSQPLMSSKKPRTIWWQRKGLLGLWLHLTAPSRPADMSELSTREYVRKAELVSLTILLVFGFLAMIISNSLNDPSTGQSCATMAVVLVIITLINRSGRVTLAAYLLVISMISLVALAIALGEARVGLRPLWFAGYDLFAVPVFFSALIIHRRAALAFALLCIAFLVLTSLLEPHALINGIGAHQFDEIQWELTQPFNNWWTLINREVTVILFAGFFGWLAAFSFEKALLWTEQANNEANLANAVAEYKEMTAQSLSQFLNELVGVFVAQANGKAFLLRARLPDDPFYHASLLLNERLRRFEQLRKQQQVWGTSQIALAQDSLSHLLTGIMQGQMPIRALAEFKTEVESAKELAQQVYTMLKPFYIPFSEISNTSKTSRPFSQRKTTGPFSP